jgi:hypothetical protein
MNPHNVSISDFKRFLDSKGCKEIRHHKGHYVYSHSKCTRPIIFQDHIDPVPLMVIKTNLRTLGLTLADIRSFN